MTDFSEPAFLPANRNALPVHILTEYTIASFGIVHKNVSHCTCKLTVLDDRRTAHSLNDTACFFQQFLIGDAQNHVFGIVSAVVIDILYYNSITLWLFAGDGAYDLSLALFYLLFECHGNGVAVRSMGGESAENAAVVIGKKRAYIIAFLESALKHTGITVFAFNQIADGDRAGEAFAYGNAHACIAVAYGMTEAAEGISFRIVECHSADSGKAVPYPYSGRVTAVNGRIDRSYISGKLFAVSGEFYCNRITL